jgi:hypothetical protein
MLSLGKVFGAFSGVVFYARRFVLIPYRTYSCTCTNTYILLRSAGKPGGTGCTVATLGSVGKPGGMVGVEAC